MKFNSLFDRRGQERARTRRAGPERTKHVTPELWGYRRAEKVPETIDPPRAMPHFGTEERARPRKSESYHDMARLRPVEQFTSFWTRLGPPLRIRRESVALVRAGRTNPITRVPQSTFNLADDAAGESPSIFPARHGCRSEWSKDRCVRATSEPPEDPRHDSASEWRTRAG